MNAASTPTPVTPTTPSSSSSPSPSPSVASSAAGAAARARRGLPAGAAFAALFILGMILSGVLGTGTYPSPLDSEKLAAEYFADNQGTVLTQGVLHLLAALPLALFASAIGSNSWARIAGWGAAAALAVSGAINMAIPLMDATGDTLHTLHYLTFLAGGQIHVPLLGVMVGMGTMALAGSAPRWTTLLGWISAGLSALSLVSFATESAMLLLPLGRFTGILWIVITAIRLGARSGSGK